MTEPALRPAAIAARRGVEIDVRDDIRAGGEPLPRIMAAARVLGDAEVLMVRAPFEPAPLYAVLGRRGFAHWTECLAADEWRVWFWLERAPGAAAGPVPVAGGATLDVRGLEPPLPMVQVLERLESLGPDGTLTVLHERRPTFLYPQLDARGFRHETDEPEPGVVRIVIRRGPP